jgi:hypothetical protein
MPGRRLTSGLPAWPAVRATPSHAGSGQVSLAARAVPRGFEPAERYLSTTSVSHRERQDDLVVTPISSGLRARQSRTSHPSCLATRPDSRLAPHCGGERCPAGAAGPMWCTAGAGRARDRCGVRYMALCASGAWSGHDRGPYLPDIRFLWPTIMKKRVPATRNARHETDRPAAQAANHHKTLKLTVPAEPTVPAGRTCHAR